MPATHRPLADVYREFVETPTYRWREQGAVPVDVTAWVIDITKADGQPVHRSGDLLARLVAELPEPWNQGYASVVTKIERRYADSIRCGQKVRIGGTAIISRRTVSFETVNDIHIFDEMAARLDPAKQLPVKIGSEQEQEARP